MDLNGLLVSFDPLLIETAHCPLHLNGSLNGAIGIIGHSIRSKSAMNAISARIRCVAMMSISGLFYIIGGQYLFSKIWKLVPIDASLAANLFGDGPGPAGRAKAPLSRSCSQIAFETCSKMVR